LKSVTQRIQLSSRTSEPYQGIALLDAWAAAGHPALVIWHFQLPAS